MDKRQIDKLLIKISTGDNAAFTELYKGTKRGIFSFVYSYCKRYEDAEDVMQTVYLKIKQNIDRYRAGTDGRAWMLQIAKNAAINEFHKNQRLVSTDDIVIKSEIDYPTGLTEIMKQVLTREELDIINLHVLWGYKHKEIATKLGCPTGTVTSKYKRSIAKLKTALKEGEK